MTNSNISLIIADDIAEKHYYEGMLLHSTQQIQDTVWLSCALMTVTSS